MSDRENRDTWPSVRREQEPPNIKRFALQPRLEPGRREQVVEGHRQFEPVFRRIKCFEIQNSDAREWRIAESHESAPRS